MDFTHVYQCIHISLSAPAKQPVPLGQRDWGDSYVYQMVHQESKKSTTTDVPGEFMPYQNERVIHPVC